MIPRRIISALLAYVMAVATATVLAGQESEPPGQEWGYAGAHGPQHWGAARLQLDQGRMRATSTAFGLTWPKCGSMCFLRR